ncbi:exonuclease [Tardiphaga alba]|uniref:DNA-directed DNA polymerase n=1 Tax=Tardiphaga alba TaxID=340268 RepID=A0ABX8AAN6_9BRAD|nr:exonuclease domain-containing protein [Tardiphaga alba]QUS39483.1 exonuclease [Tardiphaga alba]
MSLPSLPVYYYLDHFREMLGFVAETYASILTEEHHNFSRSFGRLSRDAQCLLVRMVNRRGSVFNREHFKYAEIFDLRSALEELRGIGHARSLVPDDYAAFLSRLPKTELFAGGKSAGFSDIRSSWSKPRLVEFFAQRIPFDTAVEYCDGDRFVVLAGTTPIEFQLYLYFGKTEVDLKNFALRDLGLMRTNGASAFSARFEDGDEARACFYYSQILDRTEEKCANVYRLCAEEILAGPFCPTDYAVELRGRAACRVGQFFENLGDLELANSLYRAGESADCRERLVRLVYVSGDKIEAEALLTRMIDDPLTDEELTFAADFHARKFGGRRTGACTEMLRAATTIAIDDAHRGNPEAGVASFKRRQGYRVFFTENNVWLAMFGLIFWDELFESDQLNSGFDWVPRCLKDGTFLRRFEPQIAAKLDAVRSGAALNILLRSVAGKWGRPNGLFAWDHVDLDALRCLLAGVDTAGLASILEAMCRDFRSMRDGFPDLMLVQDGKVSFSEVKAEGDVIRRNQLTRLRQLGNARIPVEIGRVAYRFDPDQDYVVVDVETTGGMASFDRITEIGAVKMRNHQIVGEWHSVLNPQRAIPSKIVQLTGITNEMVRDAPLFAAVADSFMQFMSDGIFVAHNVNFDYGFISSEYERLERRFRFPKVCTCAGMRKTHPGLGSYGLGNLSRTFGLDLETHHRALCDARAAAGLLNLMNAKRQKDSQLQGYAA